ncbi:helix-turn-helix transcriptional regulator [Gluconacetobacter takamatsuzukensis]|uniref:Helix-turn-helix domain-containing protein n=1 Tax=Gluconacetobacter takamatsuzukensis TaxID=1286190 RepID=A0A7W4PT36_9PROT|nr:helix-turn-helix domain-containing protein [Gluconacetobacter takamatsuzukensis]MBB2205556.1 helix-turn-helix domain-containing protein [Gluconacetobacter takamatsuzukensis]
MSAISPSNSLLRIDDVLRDAGISRSTTNRLINEGKLTRVKIGRATRITAESYRAWIASLSRTSAA